MAIEPSQIDRLRGQLDGELLAPGDPGWEVARFGFNIGVDPRPALISVPRSAAGAAATIRFAAEAGLRVAPQGTAHNPTPLSSLEDSVLLRTTALKSVDIDVERRTARGGAGAIWSDIVPQASEHGLAALHGSAPGLAIGGYHLGGGVGWYSRAHGLACNRVLAYDVVTADGEERRVDADSEPDLFWALRGGGGSYALVTGVELELLEIPEVYAGALFFPAERAAEVLRSWHEWTASVPEEMTSVGRLMNFPPFEMVPEPLRGKSFAILETIFIGSEDDGAELNAPLTELGPVMNSLATVPPAGIADIHMDPPGPVKGVSGHALLDNVGEATFDDLLEAVGPGSGANLTSVELRHGGGALDREAPGAGALAKLPGSHIMFAVAATMEPEHVAPAEEAIGRLNDAVKPYEAGRYLPFCETATDFGSAFSAETCERLRAIRDAHDPNRLFQANHELD